MYTISEVETTTMTRYFESGAYNGFFEAFGNELISENLEGPSHNYKVYTKTDYESCPIKSNKMVVL